MQFPQVCELVCVNGVQALSGFLFVVTCDGEVFYASHTVEQYLGFHQVCTQQHDISQRNRATSL